MAMFRRPLLGSLNHVWTFIESFREGSPRFRALPPVCRLEILRFLSLSPLARFDFRMAVDPIVSCSDAFTSGEVFALARDCRKWEAWPARENYVVKYLKYGEMIRSSV